MRERPSGSRRRLTVSVVLACGLIVGVHAGTGSAAASYPPLPLAYDQTFLNSIGGPDLTPGGSGSITFHVQDPVGFQPMTQVVVSFDVYAFNAFPGNASSTLAVASAPVLVTSNTSGTNANLSMGPLLPGGHEDGSVGVASGANTPSGTFAVRTALTFVANSTVYRLESRGWFSADQWAAATELPNGSVSVNLSALGVSGVTAETAIYVSTSNWDWALAIILGVSLVFVGAGAYVYFRRAPKSSSGAR